MNKEPNRKPIVYIVDDDQAIRHAMELLMRSVGLDYEIFHSGDEFLASHTNDRAGCLVRSRRAGTAGKAERDGQHTADHIHHGSR
jgi:FixJ family two-component response regulator